MSFEFVHTSVEKGARGDSGFTIAAITRGLPPSLEPALAELSAYDFDRSRAVGADRVDWAHRVLSVRGRSYTVISRTAPCGNDASGRPNRIAHHVVVGADERALAGPAWMLSHFRGLHIEVPLVGERHIGPELPQGDELPRPAIGWEACGFDPGWAGVVAQQLLDFPSAICCVVMPEEVDALPLACDIFALIPTESRWLVTFSTRFQRLPSGGRCQLRFLRAGAIGLKAMLAEPGARLIEIGPGLSAGESRAAVAAREGRMVEPSAPTAPRLRVHPVLQARPAFETQSARDQDAAGVYTLGTREFGTRESGHHESGSHEFPHTAVSPLKSALHVEHGGRETPQEFEPDPLQTPASGRAVTAPHIDVFLREPDQRATDRRHDIISYVLFAYAAVALIVAVFTFLS